MVLLYIVGKFHCFKTTLRDLRENMAGGRRKYTSKPKLVNEDKVMG